MDAMILAAGLGKRLGQLTRTTPKALVQVGGKSVLERVARGLIQAGADRIVINVHHHAHKIVEHVRAHGGFGVEVVFSREPQKPLETGGGLLHAAPLLRRTAPFFLHNVDVLCNADLSRIYGQHCDSGALATLAVSRRASSRLLVFHESGLWGRVTTGHGGTVEQTPHGDSPGSTCNRWAFAGIHVVSPELLDLITERDVFSIVDVYLRLAAEGYRIAPYDIGGSRWLEIGSPERLAEARRAFSA